MKVDYNFIDDKYINIETLVDIDDMFSNNDEVDSELVKHFVSEYISMIRSTFLEGRKQQNGRSNLRSIYILPVPWNVYHFTHHFLVLAN